MPANQKNLYHCSSILSFPLHLLISSLLFLCCFSIDEQGQALLSWKNILNSSTDALRTWNPSDPSPCNWFWVVCNLNGEVVQISLKSVDLQGPLPSNFQPLKSLKTLILSSTNLTGPIPKEFGEYLELGLIDLSNNAISGEIPVEICSLRKLQSLSLSTNFLEGGSPSDIGNLSGLVYLTIYDNQLSGEIPKSIGKLSKLEIFRVGGNQNLNGELPREIGNCSNLIMLGLAETSISGSLPQSIGLLGKIQTLAIYTSLLSGSIPRRIGELQKLQSLLLWQNSLVGMIPNELGSCRELMVLDLSENLLSGSIPKSFGNLLGLQELQLSINQLSGTIPFEISNCTDLMLIEVNNNDISGEIPLDIGKLRNLTLFFAWQNKLTGNIPESLAECPNLQALDLSYNHLFGPIPRLIFGLKNLTKLLLLSNNLSGFIPPDIGNCTNLYRFRSNDNRLAGTIPAEIGNLKNLNFLDISNNHFLGEIPPTISGCENLEFLDIHSNGLTGSLPETLPKSLQFLDISDNRITGPLTTSLGSLTELTKLILGKNRFSGRIPAELASCSKLQLLDLGSNSFFDKIPKELGQISALSISLNLSNNELSGEIPPQFSGLSKLGILDLSHNNLTGNVNILASLQNLVSLNISFNEFSGELPNTPFFQKLPLSDLTGNQALYISGGVVAPANGIGPIRQTKSALKLAMYALVSASVLLVLLAVYMLVRARVVNSGSMEDDTWELTLYQKLELSIDDVVRNLTSANVIGTGSSGVVYKVAISNGEMLAVKKMWSTEELGAFESEIRTLGSIRHRNIVRLLGWCSNRSMKLLFYDYLPNGSLGSLLHGVEKGAAKWKTRYDIVLGVAQALAYLHYDCVPAILHRDVKAMNVLLGPSFEPYLADFGLARLVNNDADDDSSKLSLKPHFVGSYGYMAPEQASMQCITEKSDVYSFGVVLLEVLTGRHPLDPNLPGGVHLVQWAHDHLHRKQDPADILDPKLRGQADPQLQEMLQTLAVSFLCVSTRVDDRPVMMDVVAMIKEIREADVVRSEPEFSSRGSTALSSSSARNMVLQGSSNCSFAFSDDSI
ncbi:hypothetical protein HHK36_024008 [Tetracentron sinense]|uniref:Protein kinase domain-containing protein n=1 Tax=Tetracentron sinense TaxID=13715 RepID=A0A835D977_TETSI|nr:hypothetical protein HHK36_024008 [Tetracentron sinense]